MGRGELLAKECVIKTALQVMHSRIEKTLAMQPNPEPDRAQLFLLWRQRFCGEINLGFVRVKIDIVEDRDAFDRLLGDLRAPPCLRPGVVTLPPVEAEHVPRFHEIDEMFPRRAEGVVIVIRPAQA